MAYAPVSMPMLAILFFSFCGDCLPLVNKFHKHTYMQHVNFQVYENNIEIHLVIFFNLVHIMAHHVNYVKKQRKVSNSGEQR